MVVMLKMRRVKISTLFNTVWSGLVEQFAKTVGLVEQFAKIEGLKGQDN